MNQAIDRIQNLIDALRVLPVRGSVAAGCAADAAFGVGTGAEEAAADEDTAEAEDKAEPDEKPQPDRIAAAREAATNRAVIRFVMRLPFCRCAAEM